MTFSQHVALRVLTGAALYVLFDVFTVGPITRAVLKTLPKPPPPKEPPDPVGANAN